MLTEKRIENQCVDPRKTEGEEEKEKEKKKKELFSSLKISVHTFIEILMFLETKKERTIQISVRN